MRRALEMQGVAAEIRRFEAEVPTAAAAAEQLGCETGAIANSLLFKAGDGVVLVLEVTGQQVGGVAPIGHPAALRTLVDRELTKFDVVWAGAGDDHSMFATSATGLIAMTGGELVDVAVSAGGPEA